MLLFISGSYPDSQDGIATGAKILLDAMLQHVKAEDVFLLTTDAPEIRRHLESQTSVEYALMPDWRVTPGNIRRIFRILDTYPIGAIHMEYPGNLYGKTFLASFLPALVKLYNLRRRKHIACHVRLHEFTQARFLRKVAILPILLFASSLHVPSMKDRKTVAKIAGKRVKATTIGTNIFVVPGQRQPSDQITISYFGFVYHGKGIEQMLALWQKLKAQDTEDKLRFRIIGDVGTEDTNHFADYHRQVWRWLEEYGLKDSVSVTGYISDEEVSRELRNTDIATVLYEDGLTLRRGSFLAYLAHGTPIITTQPDEEANALFAGHPGICMTWDQTQMMQQILSWCELTPEQRATIEQDNQALSQHFAWDKIAQGFLKDYGILP